MKDEGSTHTGDADKASGTPGAGRAPDHNRRSGAGFVTMLASLGLMFWLAGEPAVPSNMRKREGIFYAFAFLQGLSLGNLISYVYYVDPSYARALPHRPVGSFPDV